VRSTPHTRLAAPLAGRVGRARKRLGLKIHPARFPAALPDFFIRLLTDTDDIVLDPFAGSNTLGMVAEKLGRRWVAIEMEEDYLRASRYLVGS